jgi:vacuolar-type H+-ATPase subunit H
MTLAPVGRCKSQFNAICGIGQIARGLSCLIAPAQVTRSGVMNEEPPAAPPDAPAGAPPDPDNPPKPPKAREEADNISPGEHTITLKQIYVVLLVCVSGAVGTFVSRTLALDIDVAEYTIIQTIVAGAAAAAIMVFYLARTDTRNLVYAACFALLCGMVGPAVLQKAVEDFRVGLKAGEKVKSDAKLANESVASAPDTVEEIKEAENQANKVIDSTKEAIEKEAPAAAVETGREAVKTIIDRLQKTATAPDTAPTTATKATEAVERIAQNAQRASLPRVAEKAAEVLRSKAVIDGLVAKLPSQDDTVRHGARAQLAEIGQPAVGPLVAEVIKRRGRNNEEDYKMRLGVATALAKMKQPIELTPEEAVAVVELLKSNDAETRRLTADFLMNLEHPQTIYYAFGELKQMAANPGDPKNKVQGSTTYYTALVLGTWGRNLAATIRPPADSGVPEPTMAQAALAEAKRLRDLLQARDPLGWKETIADLNDLIFKAESRLSRPPTSPSPSPPTTSPSPSPSGQRLPASTPRRR